MEVTGECFVEKKKKKAICTYQGKPSPISEFLPFTGELKKTAWRGESKTNISGLSVVVPPVSGDWGREEWSPLSQNFASFSIWLGIKHKANKDYF